MIDKLPSDKNKVKHEAKHSMLRRMIGHDYQGRCIYMITLTTEGRKPILGTLRWTKGHPEDAFVERTQLGEEVAKCWVAIESHYHGVKSLALQIMPDHIHGILFVTQDMERHLGHMINGFKVGCNRAFRAQQVSPSEDTSLQVQSCEALPHLTKHPSSPYQGANHPKHPHHGLLFSPGFQDSILFRKGQLDNMFNYIAQNPFRLAMKRENPELFRIVSNLQINGMNFAAIGNRWLLNRPMRLQVRCHNNKTPQNLDLISKQKSYFLNRGTTGAVIVSPCISDGEKAIAREALDAHVPLIVILENGFPPMYKPPGKYFQACADGLLLMLAPWPHHTEKRTITRSQCLELNAMAKSISSEPWSDEMERIVKDMEWDEE